jgi:hypothetical protein
MLYSERQIKFVKDTEKVPLIFGGLNILHKHTHTHTISATGVQYFNYASPRALIYGFLCRNVREACLFFHHLVETIYESAITYQYYIIITI